MATLQQSAANLTFSRQGERGNLNFLKFGKLCPGDWKGKDRAAEPKLSFRVQLLNPFEFYSWDKLPFVTITTAREII